MDQLGHNLSSKGEGRTGHSELTKFNCALLGKWRWNLFHYQGELWGKILESKYGGWRNLVSERRSNKESIWCMI